jgi:hypothetical protein
MVTVALPPILSARWPTTEPSLGLRPATIPGWWWTWAEGDCWRASFYRVVGPW